MANEKFSQFATGGAQLSTDIIVGLRGGVNTQFTAGSPAFSYPYTFTGQITFSTGYAPILAGFTQNAILFAGAGGQISEDSSDFNYIATGHNLNFGTGTTIGSPLTLSAVIASTGSNLTGTGCAIVGCSNVTITGAPSNAVAIGSNGPTISGAQNIMVGGLSVGNIAGINSAGIAGNNLTITAGNNVATIGGSGNTITSGVNTVLLGGSSNVSTANNSSIVGGASNNLGSGASITGAFIAGGINNAVNANYGVALGNGSTITAANVFIWSDGTTSPTAATANSFNIIATGGIGLGTASPSPNASVDMSATTKPIKVPIISGIPGGTPEFGMLYANSATNQLMFYNGSAWVIAA